MPAIPRGSRIPDQDGPNTFRCRISRELRPAARDRGTNVRDGFPAKGSEVDGSRRLTEKWVEKGRFPPLLPPSNAPVLLAGKNFSEDPSGPQFLRSYARLTPRVGLDCPNFRKWTFISLTDWVVPNFRNGTFISLMNGTVPNFRNGTFTSLMNWTVPNSRNSIQMQFHLNSMPNGFEFKCS